MTDLSQNRLAQRCVYGGCSDAYSGFHIIYIYIYIYIPSFHCVDTLTFCLRLYHFLQFVEWRVIDSPALISKDQLAQMENLLFGHIDGRCRRTSVHSHGSVARPIQPNKGRAVHKCMCRDYLGNGHRRWYGRNRCWEGDEHVFHEQDSEGNWIASPETKPDRTAGGVWNCWHNAALIPPCCGRTFDPFHDCCAQGTC